MGSKNSNKVQKVVMGLLVLWSIASIIIIVVWATSPDLKGSAQCRAELREATEKMEGAKVVFEKDRRALEEKAVEAWKDQDRLKAHILLLQRSLNATNVTLEECRLKNVVLAENVTALQDDVRLLQHREANLTEQLGLQEERIEALQHNLTQAFHQTESCFSLKTAAESQMAAAQSQTKACESKQQYLEKQLQKCKASESEAPEVKQEGSSASSSPSSAAAPLAGIPALTLLICAALHLIT
ncbi:uncharacterized protein si:ch211-1a19.3 [Poeciliopsis prolifica]|uniref:uncharacterized protein si:ch211-1a19.3 n=1 Tax=Poeciliopsis prolifica TaxID=188132 RepID=UPI0024132E53|nr:uncharacterized protein si:ch211-1a19.3 [Poeciliopsis prolifica]